VAVFDKLCRIAQFPRAHRTDSLSVMGHAWLAAVCYTEWEQKQQNLNVIKLCVSCEMWFNIMSEISGFHKLAFCCTDGFGKYT